MRPVPRGRAQHDPYGWRVAPTPGAPQLIGREDELRRIAAIADDALRAHGRALLIEGEPGVGKSALLAGAELRGLRVLKTTGTDSAFDVPLSGVIDLLSPVADRLAALAPGPRAALAAVLEAGVAPPGVDTGVLMHAAAQLLERVARDTPLIVLVDDVQWLDPSSQEVVRFAARRAERIACGFVLVRSLRGERPGAWTELDTLRLRDLPRSEAIELALARGAELSVAERLVDALGGNPLALSEAPEELTASQREGREPLPDPLPAGRRILLAYQGRLDALEDRTRRALLLLAVSERPQTMPILNALSAEASRGIFDEAEAAGLVRLSPGAATFAHPLVRSAVLHAAGSGASRAAHAALAEVTELPDQALHAAAAAEQPDEAIAAALEQLGHAALQRGAAASAIELLARSAALTPEAAAARPRALTAAAVANMAGRPGRAIELLDPLLAAATEPSQRADVQVLRGMAMQLTGRPTDAAVMLEREADAIVDLDPIRASSLLTQAGVALAAEGPLERLVAVAARAAELAPAPTAIVATVLHAEALASLGDHAQARMLLHQHRDALLELDPTGPGHEVLTLAGLAWLWMEDYDDADRLLGHLVDTARARGAVGALAFPLAVLATLRLRQGDLQTADRLAQEALDLSEDGVGGFVQALCLTAAGFTAGQLGRIEESEQRCAAAVAIGDRLALRSALASAEQGRGFAALSAGDVTTAITHLERARAHTERFGNVDPSFLYTLADLADAYARAGRRADAAAATEQLAIGAQLTGGRWARAATARCRALTAPAPQLDELLAEATAAHDAIALPFERARTQLCFGERLRRSRRRADARVLLEQARETFSALGSVRWEERAVAELDAAGGRRNASTSPPALAPQPLTVLASELTARELEVCRIIASGATNAEAASALFLSERTIEHHLRMAYRKLGVRSRSQLASRFR